MLGGGAGGRAVVVFEQAAQVPGDGRMDGVVALAVAGEQAGLGGWSSSEMPFSRSIPATAVTGPPSMAG